MPISNKNILRYRSKAYPAWFLYECLEIVQTIYTQYGRGVYISREVIADALGFAANSIQTKLSSCVQYGLLELRDGEGYKPTELFLALYKPIGPFELAEARYMCFKNPKVYDAIITDFNYSQLPVKEKLAILLFRNYYISETAAERAAEVFIGNAEILGFVKEGVLVVEHPGQELASSIKLNILDIENTNNELTKKHSKVLNGPIKMTELIVKAEPEKHMPPLTINLKSDRTVLIKFPKNVSSEDIDRTIKFLEFYKEGME